MYVNRYDTTKHCAFIGNYAEDKFEQWLISQGREYRRATTEEQYLHIDFFVQNPITKEIITVDVKSPKSICRGGAVSSQILWVEFKNVQGKEGWLYGKNGYVAFYHPFHQPRLNSKFYGSSYSDYFIVVKTSEFAKFCEKLCVKGRTNNPKDALYKRYTRDGRKDEISMITMQDVYDW